MSPVDIGDDDPVTRRGRVYFIAARQLGTVKVGFSTNLPKRLIDLQTSASTQLALEFSCAGDRGLERALHGFLLPYRATGEWFQYGPHIHDLIDEISDFLSEKGDDEDVSNVSLSATEFHQIVSSPTFGKTDADIHAEKVGACGNNRDNRP